MFSRIYKEGLLFRCFCAVDYPSIYGMMILSLQRFEVMTLHRKARLIAVLIALLLLTGCAPKFDGSSYISSMLDALYKANYTSCAELTGSTTAELSATRETWIGRQADRFLDAFGAAAASDATRDRVILFLNNMYANASFSVRASDAGNLRGGSASGADAETVFVSFRPMTLIPENYEALQKWQASFNQKNTSYTYADLDSMAYTDAYMDGLMTVLEQQLTNIPLGEEVTFRIPVNKGEDGLYAADAGALARLANALLPFEAPPAPPETEAPETEAPETKAPETKAPETKAPETETPETKAPETKAPKG